MTYENDPTKAVEHQIVDAVDALAALIASGKIPVDIGSSLVNVDLATVDVAALIAGIANGKTLAELYTLLGSPPQKQVLSAAYPKKISVSATATLETLGATIPAGAKRVVLWPESASVAVRMAAGGAASASSAQVPTGGISIDCTKAVADTWQLYAASAVAVSVFVYE